MWHARGLLQPLQNCHLTLKEVFWWWSMSVVAMRVNVALKGRGPLEAKATHRFPQSIVQLIEIRTTEGTNASSVQGLTTCKLAADKHTVFWGIALLHFCCFKYLKPFHYPHCSFQAGTPTPALAQIYTLTNPSLCRSFATSLASHQKRGKNNPGGWDAASHSIWESCLHHRHTLLFVTHTAVHGDKHVKRERKRQVFEDLDTHTREPPSVVAGYMHPLHDERSSCRSHLTCLLQQTRTQHKVWNAWLTHFTSAKLNYFFLGASSIFGAGQSQMCMH